MLMRTAKISVRLTRRQQSQLRSLMAAQRWCYNQIVEALRLLTSPVYPIANGDAVRHCFIRGKGAEKARRNFIESGETVVGVPVIQWRDDWSFDAWREIKALCDRQPAPFDSSSKYGISAKQASAICQSMRGQIKGYFTHRKRGNFKAQLPTKFRSFRDASGRLWDVGADECRWFDGKLQLGTKTQIGGFLSVQVSRKFQGVTARKVSLSIDESGQPWLHLSHEVEDAPLRELPHTAAIDPGQIRAMVVSDDTGRIRSVTGRSVMAIKRDRERQQKSLNRLRSRVFEGQKRQYLSKTEAETMAALERKTPGAGTKYAHQMVAKRRREEQLERHIANGGTPETFRYCRYSKREWKLLQAYKRSNTIARRKLSYVNHCITRRVANWCSDRGVGVVFLGDVHSIPKGRKKGATRRLQSKRNALWEIGNQQKLLAEKLEEYGATLSLQSERYTSQTCPKCEARYKPRGRRYVCRSCGWKGDRDGVGAANILSDALTLDTRILPGRLKPLSLSPVMKKKDARKLERDVPSRLVGQSSSPESGDSLPRTKVRESVGVPIDPVGDSPRNARHAGKTKKSAVKKVRAKRENLATTSIAATERLDDPYTNNLKEQNLAAIAQPKPKTFLQLALWG